MMTRSANQVSRGVRRGSAMILVLITVAIAFVMGLTFLASSTTTTGVAQTMVHHAQARQIAESGLAMAVSYVQQNPDWRDVRSSGSWVSGMNLYGGTVSITGEFNPEATVPINDTSFDLATGELANPDLNPPMSGAVGGWQMQRSSAIETGPTVPQMNVSASPSATNGSNIATISFGAAIDGTGTFSQTLALGLNPNTVYELAVDIRTSGLPILDSAFGFRLLAGNTIVASSDHAATLVLPAPLGQPPTPPSQPPMLPEIGSVLEIAGLSGGFSEYTLRFVTDAAPAAGLMRIELFARSTIGTALSVNYDHVRMKSTPDLPLVLTAVGRCDDASYRVSVAVNPATTRVVSWNDS